MRRSALLLLAFAVTGCASSRVTFVGRTRTPTTEAHAVQVHASSQPPSGYEVIGVTTAVCETYDGAAGLTERACSEEELTREAGAKAAEVGGALLVEPACMRVVLEQTVERLKGGGAKPHVRERLECRYSVAGHTNAAAGSPLNVASTAEPTREGPRELEVNVAGKAVAVRIAATRTGPVPHELGPDDVGELARVPENAIRYGRIASECRDDCASAVARRGLKAGAAKLGATVLVDVHCEPIAERWACTGDAYGDSPPPAF